MEIEKNFPLQQGNLDWLCSVYATINAMYLAIGDEEWPVPLVGGRSFAEKLFIHLIERITLEGNLFLALTKGVDPDDVFWLSNIAKKYFNNRPQAPQSDRSQSVVRKSSLGVRERQPKVPIVSTIDGHIKNGGQVIIRFVRDEGGFPATRERPVPSVSSKASASAESPISTVCAMTATSPSISTGGDA